MVRKTPLDPMAFSLEKLDPGIRETVRILRKGGIETFASCEGGRGHPYPEPTVRFHGDHSEGYKALAVALQHALPVTDLRRTWDILDGELVGPYWELVFLAPHGHDLGWGVNHKEGR